MVPRTDREFLAVARGDSPPQLLLRNARVVNVFSRSIREAHVAIHGGRFVSIGPARSAEREVDLDGAFLSPGLIDAHMHVESTMMMPSAFVDLAVPDGTTGVVLDPHEIANVLGLPGIRLLMDDARGLSMNMFFAASSCVPSSPLESAGAALEANTLAALFDDPRVVALAEVMNFPGVIHADPGVLAKVRLGLERRVVDGHCPGLAGSALDAYVAAGISSDHESITADEAREKVDRGLYVYLREGSAARNLEALLPSVTPQNAHRFCLCTDDRHPTDLRDEGHLGHVVRRAISMGLDPLLALTMGSFHAAERFRLSDLGAIAPGRIADCFSFASLESPRADRVWVRGRHVASGGRMLTERTSRVRVPEFALATVRLLPEIPSDALDVPGRSGRIRVIEMRPHQLVTGRLSVEPTIRGDRCVSNPARDVLKIAVFERHAASGRIGIGFVRGFGLKKGAIASTVGHDAHNLAVVGADDSDMLHAARILEGVGGGQCVVVGGRVVGLLELPVAGLMSDLPARDVAQRQQALLATVPATGCPLEDPFMPLSFMSLPVIPSLKLTDLGLVDVDEFRVVPLWVDAEAVGFNDGT
ncbi:MAG: adenine deaminase [Phycisphaeraceae bacterium]|nr:adenine deaminase [Phycisphaeraceae bacterium]